MRFQQLDALLLSVLAVVALGACTSSYRQPNTGDGAVDAGTLLDSLPYGSDSGTLGDLTLFDRTEPPDTALSRADALAGGGDVVILGLDAASGRFDGALGKADTAGSQADGMVTQGDRVANRVDAADARSKSPDASSTDAPASGPDRKPMTSINPLTCANGQLDPDEDCDDGNVIDGDGCSGGCQIEADAICPEPGKPCLVSRFCGDGVVASTEVCDDGNLEDGDGCSKDCVIEEGWECRLPGRRCSPICGDGRLAGSEECDDGNNDSGDGCSSRCLIEPGADCPDVGKRCQVATCGNGIVEIGEQCDCGTDYRSLPQDCAAVNGLFYGDHRGCSKACTKEPTCLDSFGNTQACSKTCGDGNLEPGEDCDDGNLLAGDGCSTDCHQEDGFVCTTSKLFADRSTCQSGSGSCLELPIVYRDFQPENVIPGGHPDFFFLGTRYDNSTGSTTVCVPNSAGPGKGNDSTARCWGIAADRLSNGKPQPGSTRTCACQFSDWSLSNSGRIPGRYTKGGNDSPLSDGQESYLGGTAGSSIIATSTTGDYKGVLKGYTSGDVGGPIFSGTTPAYKDANSFKQWFTDDPSVNQTFSTVLELEETSSGSNVFRFASKTHLASGGFFPLDTLNPSQATLCNLWPYWNHGNGTHIWGTSKSSCKGDQYLFPPRVTASDCPGDSLDDGCWVTGVQGQLHDSYFTDEARYYFVYNANDGVELSFYGDDDLFVFINGVLVLDLGGVHQQLPGKVQVKGDPGDAQVTEGGCLNSSGTDIVGVTPGATDCSPLDMSLRAAEGDDFRLRRIPLGLQSGRVYEIAIFGADRHPPDSNYQLTLTGRTVTRSVCQSRCGDGVLSGDEECDDGDDTTRDLYNDDNVYGGCTTRCKLGPYCGDGRVDEGVEQCDDGRAKNGTPDSQCMASCRWKHFCGDGLVDTVEGETCDLGVERNGAAGSGCDRTCRRASQ